MHNWSRYTQQLSGSNACDFKRASDIRGAFYQGVQALLPVENIVLALQTASDLR
jgi:hypothetical protein